MPLKPTPPRPPVTRRTLLARAGVAATSAAAAAAFAALPVDAPAPAPVSPVSPALTAPAAPVSPSVVPVAAVSRTFDLAALRAAAAPAAQRASAMKTALGKVGSPYRWGAAGPRAFDCSGLVTYAFGSAGKSLPRSARAMSRTGTPVAKGDLRPGDLVFFYKASHVGIYIGNGKVVHASNPRHPVKVAAVSSMPFHSARRV